MDVSESGVIMRASFCALLALAVSACGGGSTGGGDTAELAPVAPEPVAAPDDPPKAPEPIIHGGGPATEQLSYHFTLNSFDGTPIAMSVFQPALEEGQAAPLLLYSHGWGGSRSTDLAQNDVMTETARRAWENGYFVVTFDQRGFGDSGGEAHVQNPEIEGRDIQTILDWAEGALTPHLAYLGGDPMVGALGLSYGGGFQLVGASVDPRFDALVPLITWHDLSYSLNPNDVPKTAWGLFLITAGNLSGSPASWTSTALFESLAGSMGEATKARFAANGLGAFCRGEREDGLGVPQVDTFFIQGVNDTLFNTNEAVWNHQCLSAAGNDSYLLVARGGHVLPVMQELDGMIGGFDTHAQCGDKRYSISDMAYRFLDGKLRQLKKEIDIPRVCFVQDNARGLVTNKVPVGGPAYDVSTPQVITGLPSIDLVRSLLTTLLTRPDVLVQIAAQLGVNATDLITSLLASLLNPASIPDMLPKVLALVPPELLDTLVTAPTFEPLFTANAEQVLAGIPLASFTVHGNSALDPRVFVGVGVKRYGSQVTELLHEQVTPIRGTGTRELELTGISTLLQPGDQVGLVLYGFHPQFASSFTRVPSAVRISGRVEMPLH